MPQKGPSPLRTRNIKVIAAGAGALLLILAAGAAGIAYRVGQLAARETIELQSALRAGNLRLGEPMPDFLLVDREGNSFQLHDAIDGDHYVVISFHHPDCPCSENCGKLISEMQGAGYDDVRVIGVMSAGTRETENLKNLQSQIDEKIITFPVYMDHGGVVQRLLGASRTPEVWVLDKQGVIRYYGAPENSLFPGSKGHRYLLREAIDALRDGRVPEVSRYDPIGCPIGG